MAPEYWIIGTVTLLLLTLGIVERRAYQKHIARIPIRVHVNGTRGKSSVVRLIAAGLRLGGIRTFAKTSGTVAMRILPDGTEQPVQRVSKANVNEQARIVSMAAAAGAEALVIECMALHPTLQAMTERHFIRSTHGVITNVGPDHLEVMGPTPADVAAALAGTVPIRGTLYTAERDHRDVLEAAAADRDTAVVAVGREQIEQVSAEELAAFDYIEHADNVALALAVCQDLGVDRQTALRGMWQAPCDAGAMTVHRIRRDGRHVCFVNAFAANDPRFTEQAWHEALDRFPKMDRRVMLVNCRADRPDRSRQLGAVSAGWRPADCYMVMGKHMSMFIKSAAHHGLAAERIRKLRDQSPRNILRRILSLGGQETLVVGVGNMGRAGLALVRWLKRHARQEAHT